MKEDKMKKVFLCIIVLATLTFCVACGGNDSENAYSSICQQLEKTSMVGTEYSQSKIAEFETRFTSMNLTGGFSKVNHFRSTTEYVYVIEFENADDVSIFFDKISAANFAAKKFDSIVVYGESGSIDDLNWFTKELERWGLSFFRIT